MPNLIIAFLLVFLSTKASSELEIPSEKIERPYLWEASKGQAKIHLLGTLHVGIPFENFKAKVKNTFRAADIVATEIDSYNFGNALLGLGQLFLLPFTNPQRQFQEESLENYLSLENQNILRYLFATYSNLDPNRAMYLKPASLLINTVSINYGIIQEGIGNRAFRVGMDHHINMLANHSWHQDARGLESPNTRLNLLSQYVNNENINEIISYTYQSLYRLNSYEEIASYLQESTISGMNQMFDDYYAGDIRTEESKCSRNKTDYQEAMYLSRNTSWFATIKNWIQREPNKRIFVAAGLCHFMTEYSLLEMLRSDGFEITRLEEDYRSLY